MAETKVEAIIKVSEDGTTEILEGESLEYFITLEKAAFSLLATHKWAQPKIGEIKWIPIKKVRITR